jgi:predicted enzyme related to lactoylglutathione lyase
MGNPVVHFEIGAADEGQLVRFYGEVFGVYHHAPH